MFNPLTLTASFLTVYLVAEFVMGLVQLWNASGTTAAAIAPAVETEVDDSIYDVIYDESHDLSEYIASYANSAPISVEVANYAAPELAAAYAEATLESQTIRQLKALAKERGLKKYSYLTKAELIAALM